MLTRCSLGGWEGRWSEILRRFENLTYDVRKERGDVRLKAGRAVFISVISENPVEDGKTKVSSGRIFTEER